MGKVQEDEYGEVTSLIKNFVYVKTSSLNLEGMEVIEEFQLGVYIRNFRNFKVQWRGMRSQARRKVRRLIVVQLEDDMHLNWDGKCENEF